MGKHRNATKTGGAQRYTFPTPLCHGGKLEDTSHDLLEKVSSQMGMSPKAPFRFTNLSRFPSIQSLSPEGIWAHLMTSDNWTHYCVHVRVTLGEKCDHSPPSHAWRWIANFWHVSRMVLKNGSPKLWSWHQGGHLVFWKMITLRGALLYKCKEHWIHLDRSSKLGQENSTSWSDCKYRARGLSSCCGSSHGEEDKGQGAWTPPRVGKSHPVLRWHL